MAAKNANKANGTGIRTCHNFAPAIIKIINDSIHIKAAVPKSSTIIRAAVRPIIVQMGTNLFRNKPSVRLDLSQKAAKKIRSDHVASSEG